MNKHSNQIHLMTTICIGLLISFSVCALCQTNTQVPFKFNGHIIIPLKVEDSKELDVIVDTGYPGYLTLTHSELGDELGLEFSGKPRALRGGGSSKTTTANISRGVRFSIGDIEYKQQMIVVIDEKREDSLYNFDGAIGSLIFLDYVVEINFDKSIIYLSDPGTFKPKDGWMEIPIIVDKNIPFIETRIDTDNHSDIPVKLFIDTGGRLNLALIKNESTNLISPNKAINALAGIGLSGELYGEHGRISGLSIGKYFIKDIVTLFIEKNEVPDIGIEFDGLLGIETLYRFNQIYDYANNRIFLKPNKYFSDPFEINMAGIFLLEKYNGDKYVFDVIENSPGFYCGLKKGDKIISINGKNATDYNLFEAKNIFKQEGKTVKLLIQRDTERFEKTILLKRII